MMLLAANPTTIVTNLETLLGVVLVCVAGLIAVMHMARHRILAIIITIAGAALVYLALKGTLIVDVAGWFTALGV